MEKNKRRRVTHMGSGLDNIEDGCRDYVSSIIEEMDSNFKTFQPNKLYRSKKVVSLTEPVNDVEGTSSVSTSKAQPQVITSKSKKFGIPRKFPLMEKSQKILRHIKHNQQIPKQRAHLASFSDSSIQKEITRDTSNVINENSKQSTSKTPKTCINSKTSKTCINSKTSKNCINTKTSKTCIKPDEREANKKLSTELAFDSSTVNHNVDNDENTVHSDTTDSEYERFVKKNTKHLKKKCKKQKTSANKNKTNKKSLNKSKNTVRQCHSSDDDDDDDTPSSNSKCKKRRSLEGHDLKKKKCKPLPSESETDNDEIFNSEIFTRDTSSESDIGDDIAVRNISFDSDSVKRSEACSTPKPQSLNVENDVTNERSLCNSSLGDNNAMNDIQVSMHHVGQTNEHSLHNSSSSGDKSIINETQVSMHPIEQTTQPPDCSSVNNKSLPKPHDLPVLSSSESCAATNKIQSDEESDIEIVTVILPSSSNATVKCNKEKEKNISTEIVKQQNSKIHVKVEDSKQLTKRLSDKANDSDKTRKNEAVYTTDICRGQEKTDSNNKKVKEEDSDDDIAIVDCILNKKCLSIPSVSLNEDKRTDVKMETSISVNKPNIKNESNLIDSSSMKDKNPSNPNVSEIFNRNDNVTLKDLKLYEVAQSNLAHTKNLSGEMLQRLMPSVDSQVSGKESVDVVHLLDLFKKEFQIYQEIIQTEANVEKSLKTIESYQAEKLKNIRTLIQKAMEDKLHPGEEKNLKANEILKFPCGIQGVSKLEPPEKLKTSPGSPLKAAVSSWSNPLCTNMDKGNQDMKPDLSLLHNISGPLLVQHPVVTPKIEPTSAQELPDASAIKLLGEKCNVCGKEAVAACQRCAKVFFCSNECGKKYWMDGHENECGK